MKETAIQSKGSRELVLISGTSGTGKSALALSLRDRVESAGGAFLSGKFDSFRMEPYSGISQVIRELCGKLLMEPKEKQTLIINAFEQALGNELLVLLLTAFPELDELIPNSAAAYPNQPDPMSLGTNSQHQLNHAFRLLMRIVCAHYKPLVVHLDDLQWADMASLNVLEVLLTDRQNTGLLVIGCYRSNEVDDSHLFSKCLRDLKEKSNNEEEGGGHIITEMDIGNLSLEQVNEVIMTLLCIDPAYGEADQTGPLADVCMRRTEGNPLFLISFIILLCQEEYLTFNFGTFQWTWEVNTIEAETASTDNVVEVMMKKMNQINPDLGRLLQIAALLGASFDHGLLFLVWNKLPHDAGATIIEDHKSLLNLLEQAVEQKFIEVAGPNGYRWVHDKVQEAAHSLIESDLPTFQLFDVGMVLLRNIDDQTLDSLIFVILDLLNSKDCLDVDLNIEIAKLSAKATRKARELSAFSSTAKYAAIGIQHLEDKNMWETNYDLTLELHCAAAEAESVLGNTDSMKVYADEVLNEGRTILDKVPIYYCLATSKGKLGQFVDSNNLCVDAINHLEVTKIPTGVSLAVKTVSGLLSTKKTLVSADADKLPKMTDPKQIATMKLLDLCCSYAFQAKNVLLLLFCTVKMVRLTVKHGISSSSPSALAQYGGLVFGVLNDLKTGIHIGEMALAMVNRLEGQANKALVTLRTFGFMLSYSRPIHDLLKPLLQGHSDGMKFGDTEMSSWCLFKHTYCSFHVSKPLRIIEEDCRLYTPYIHDLGWTEVYESTKYVYQSVLYLMGKEDEDSLTFLFKNPAKGEEKFSYIAQAVVRSAAYTYTADYEEGAEYALVTGDAVKKGAPGHVLVQGDVFTRCICLYAMAQKTKKRKYKKPARALRKLIENWRKQGGVNFEHQILLLTAEEAALSGKKRKASNLYQEAIVSAARFGFLRDAGLIHERYANFFLQYMREEDSTKHHVRQSIKFYQEWGALRAVEGIVSKYTDLFSQGELSSGFVGDASLRCRTSRSGTLFTINASSLKDDQSSLQDPHGLLTPR